MSPPSLSSFHSTRAELSFIICRARSQHCSQPNPSSAQRWSQSDCFIHTYMADGQFSRKQQEPTEQNRFESAKARKSGRLSLSTTNVAQMQPDQTSVVVVVLIVHP